MKKYRDLLISNNEYSRIFYIDEINTCWCIYDDNKIQIFLNDNCIYNLNINEGIFYYSDGTYKIHIIEKDGENLDVSLINIIDGRIIKKRFINNNELMDVIYDDYYESIIFIFENEKYLFNQKYEILEKIELDFIDNNQSYLYVNYKDRIAIQQKENFPNGFLAIYDELISYDYISVYKNKIYIVKNTDGKGFFRIKDIVNKDILFEWNIRGYITDYMHVRNCLVIIYIKDAMSYAMILDINNLEMRNVLKSKYRLNIENIINKKIYISETRFNGYFILEINKEYHYTLRNPFLFENREYNYEYISNNKYKGILVNNNSDNNEKPVIISFHGGPNSVEVLDNRYGDLYNHILNKDIEVLIFNYPGSVSFTKTYEYLPYKNWKYNIQKSFDLFIEKLGYKNRKYILLGASFGATVGLLINNPNILEKILINPMVDLIEHTSKLDSNYQKWFKMRFSHQDEADISIDKIFYENKNTNITYILGENDEIINYKKLVDFYNSKNNKKHKIYIDKGSHNSNNIHRKNLILKTINNL